MQELLRENRKAHLGHGLLDLALVLAVLRYSEVTYFSLDIDIIHNDVITEQEAFFDDGPLLGITTTYHHFHDNTWYDGPRFPGKLAYVQNDDGMDEYENIMRDLRSRPPVMFTPPNEEVALTHVGDINNDAEAQPGLDVITMVLGIANPGPGQGGGVQVANRADVYQEGAVGGVGIGPYFPNDDTFDLFGDIVPRDMADDEIDNLILSPLEGNGNDTRNTLPDNLADLRWQQYISGFDTSMTYQGPLAKCGYGTNGTFGWGGDILNEAILNAELFSPTLTTLQNGHAGQDTFSQIAQEAGLNPFVDNYTDPVMSARLEVMNSHEWECRNHENELFPNLTPPPYDEVMAADAENSTVVATRTNRHTDAMHDHNYFNASVTNRIAATTRRRQAQNRGYAIRSRQEVSTRVITVAPRNRHVSNATSSENDVCDGAASDVSSEISTQDTTTRRTTIGSDASIEEDIRQAQIDFEENVTEEGVSQELDRFEIQSMDSSYYVHLINDVQHRRREVACN